MPELPPRLQVLYPFKGRFFGAPEGRLHYVDEGEGPAVVMLHGNPTWSFFYRDVILAMRESRRCLALDHLGCGLSDKPQDYAHYTLEQHIDRACAWLEHCGVGDFHLVVHDWGGAIGFGVAQRLPERISRITILNTAAFAFPSLPGRIAVCRMPVFGRLAVRGANAFARGAVRMTTVQPLSEAVAEGYLFPYDSWHNRIALHAFVKDIPMRPGHPSWEVLKSIEGSLSQWRDKPVRIVWGMRDWCFHEKILEVWESILPDAEVHRLEQAGHYLLEDAGEEAVELIGKGG